MSLCKQKIYDHFKNREEITRKIRVISRKEEKLYHSTDILKSKSLIILGTDILCNVNVYDHEIDVCVHFGAPLTKQITSQRIEFCHRYTEYK